MKSLLTHTLPRILLLLLLGIFVLGQFGRIELGAGRALYFQDIILALLFSLTVLTHGKALLSSLIHTTLFRVWILFVLWISFTTLLNFHDDVSQMMTVFLYMIRLHCILGFGLLLSELIKEKVIHARELQWGILLIGSLIAFLGFVQYAIFPDTRGLQLLGWDDHYYRLISTIFDPGFTGVILALVSLYALCHALQSQFQRKIGLFVSASTLVGLLLTYSRASYLAFLTGLCVLAWYRKQIRLLFIIPLFVTAVLLLPRPGGEGVKLERTASVVSRIESVESATADLTPFQLILGKGLYAKKQTQAVSKLGSLTIPNHSSAPENSYIFVLSSLGIVGLVIVSVFGFWVERSVRWEGTAIVSLSAVGVHALFSNTWFHPFVLLLLVTILVSAKASPTASR